MKACRFSCSYTLKAVFPQLPTEGQEGRSGPADRGMLTYPLGKQSQNPYQGLVIMVLVI